MTTVAKDVVFKVRFDFEAAKKQLDREASSGKSRSGAPRDSRASKVGPLEAATIARSAANTFGLGYGGTTITLGSHGSVDYGTVRTPGKPPTIGVDGPLPPKPGQSSTSPWLREMHKRFKEMMTRPSSTWHWPLIVGGGKPSWNYPLITGLPAEARSGASIAKSASAAKNAASIRHHTNESVATGVSKAGRAKAVPGGKKAFFTVPQVVAGYLGAKEIYAWAPVLETFATGTNYIEQGEEKIRVAKRNLARWSGMGSLLKSESYRQNMFKLKRAKNMPVIQWPGDDPAYIADYQFEELKQAQDRCYSRQIRRNYGNRVVSELAATIGDVPIYNAINKIFGMVRKIF